MADNRKPHAVIIPGPFQSHIKAHLKLAKLLYHKGFYITFVNTEFNHKRFLKSQTDGSSLGFFPRFRFESIPDGLPDSDSNPDASQDVLDIVSSIRQNLMGPPLLNLIKKINHDASSTLKGVIPPVSCIFSDAFMTFTMDVSRELSIPIVMFFTIAASVVMTLKQFRALIEKQLVPLQDESTMDVEIDWIPGLKSIRFKELPSYARIRDPNDLMFNFIMESVDKAIDASAIVIETFTTLEQEVLKALVLIYPQVYLIAPLQLLLDRFPQDDNLVIPYSLWYEEKECLQWLDKQKPNSVLYVNFGSIATIERNQLVEFALGFLMSNHPFLWIIRPDLVDGDNTILPNEVKEKIEKGKGFVASWCDQETVLNHESIGGFMTHCGWNSVVESLSSGVPMLCYPCFGDQQMNAWLASGEFGVGVAVKTEMKRDDIAEKVKEMMEGEDGKAMKAKAMEWKRLANDATSSIGSSLDNLEILVHRFMSI